MWSDNKVGHAANPSGAIDTYEHEHSHYKKLFFFYPLGENRFIRCIGFPAFLKLTLAKVLLKQSSKSSIQWTVSSEEKGSWLDELENKILRLTQLVSPTNTELRLQ